MWYSRIRCNLIRKLFSSTTQYLLVLSRDFSWLRSLIPDLDDGFATLSRTLRYALHARDCRTATKPFLKHPNRSEITMSGQRVGTVNRPQATTVGMAAEPE